MKIQAITAIIVNDKKEILLVRRGKEPFAQKWALISGIGAAKKGLLPEEAVRDEVQFDIQTAYQHPRYLFTLPVNNDGIVNEEVVYCGIVDPVLIKVHPPFTLEYRWCAEKEIGDLSPLAFNHNQIIGQYLQDKHPFESPSRCGAKF